jgi:hypothetical protein
MGYGIRVSSYGKVRIAVDGETSRVSGPQAASLTWAAAIGGNYSEGNDDGAFYDLPGLLAHHAGKSGAKEKLLGLLDCWREACDAIVTTHVTVPEAAAVVGAVLDQLAVRQTHPEFGSQVSGARRKILAFSAAEQRPDSVPASAFRAVLAILVAIDAAFRCNLAGMAARAFEGPHALMLVSVFLHQLHLRTVAMTFGRKHPLRLLFADDVVLAAGLKLFCIEVGRVSRITGTVTGAPQYSSPSATPAPPGMCHSLPSLPSTTKCGSRRGPPSARSVLRFERRWLRRTDSSCKGCGCSCRPLRSPPA